MLKKIKSLLFAGFIALSVCGPVFADGNGNDGCYLGEAKGCVSEHKNSNEHKISNITESQWKAYVAKYNSQVDGYEIVLQSENNGNGWHTWKVMHDGEQVEVIHVKYNKQLTNEEKFEKVEKPSIPGEEPETGDASSLTLLGTVVLSVAGILVLKNKKDEE